MSDIYSINNQDFRIRKGDTVNGKFSFSDENGVAIDITSYSIKFSMKHPITGEIVQMLDGVTEYTKNHDDSITNSNGILLYGDVQATALGLTLSANNQLILVLDYSDTKDLDALVYPFDIEFSFNGDLSKFTAVSGRIIVSDEVTPS